MKDLGIQKPFLQPIETNSPQVNNYYPVRKLFRDYLTKLNVPFIDQCCGEFDENDTTPVRFNPSTGDLEYYSNIDEGTWQVVNVGGGARFGVFGEDDSATQNRIFAFNDFDLNIGGGSNWLTQFDTFNFASKNEGSMMYLNWNTASPIVTLGDLGNWGNGLIATIDDPTGTFDITSADLDAAYSVEGQVGVSGTFTAQSGETITVTGGIITAITGP